MAPRDLREALQRFSPVPSSRSEGNSSVQAVADDASNREHGSFVAPSSRQRSPEQSSSQGSTSAFRHQTYSDSHYQHPGEDILVDLKLSTETLGFAGHGIKRTWSEILADDEVHEVQDKLSDELEEISKRARLEEAAMAQQSADTSAGPSSPPHHNTTSTAIIERREFQVGLHARRIRLPHHFNPSRHGRASTTETANNQEESSSANSSQEVEGRR